MRIYFNRGFVFNGAVTHGAVYREAKDSNEYIQRCMTDDIRHPCHRSLDVSLNHREDDDEPVTFQDYERSNSTELKFHRLVSMSF